MPFTEIKGQELAVNFLKSIAESGKAGHAYIFAGPPGCGNIAAAREFAKALNCEGSGERPCGVCQSCSKIERDIHPDVKRLRKDEKSGQLKIDQVRRLESEISLKPYEARSKVYIVEDADRMNIEASSSFLKTLEEPPDNSVLILICERPRDLLPTVASRCQLVRFRPVGTEALSSSQRDEILSEFSREDCIDSYSGQNRTELAEKLKILISWYRDLLVFKTTHDERLIINSDRLQDIRREAEAADRQRLMSNFEDAVRTKKNIEDNVNPKLALAALFKDR